MTIPPRSMTTRDIMDTVVSPGPKNPYLYSWLIILMSVLGSIIALAVLWWSVTSPPRAAVQRPPLSHARS